MRLSVPALFMRHSMRQDDSGGYMEKRSVPETVAEDDDDVVVALETARVSEERDDLRSAQEWLHRAAAAARRQGRPDRAGALSRSAARIVGRTSEFEPQEDGQQVLSDIDEDFAEQTIVETVEEIARKTDRPEPEQDGIPKGKVSTKEAAVSSGGQEGETVVTLSRAGAGEGHSFRILDKPTPLAPFANQEKQQVHQAVRVAVKKTLGGRFEARPLGPGESVSGGEQEALLVPIEVGARL